MEAEDAVISTAAAEAAADSGDAVDMSEPQTVLQTIPSLPANFGSASEEPLQPTAPNADVEPQTSDHSLHVDPTPSEAGLSAQSEQSIQADISEILAPSPSMTLLHSQRAGLGTEAPATDVQLDRPASPTQQTEQPVEGEEADTAQVSSTEATATTGDSSVAAAEQVSPAEDALAASEKQEGGTAPVVHATFVVPTENWKHSQMVPLATTAAEIKHSLCSNWNIAESALSVKYNKQELQDAQSLASCGIQATFCLSLSTTLLRQILTRSPCAIQSCARLSCFHAGR